MPELDQVPVSNSAEPSWQARALAAEKTVRVLKQSVLTLMSGVHKSVIEKQLVQEQKRFDALTKRRELMELRAAELQRHSEALEREVADRTRTIRTILDNVTFGFLLVDRDLLIQPGCTRSCSELLGCADLSGRRLSDLLAFGRHARDTFQMCVEQIFEDILPEAVSIQQLPTRFQCGSRILRIEARTVRNDAGLVATLLLSIVDASVLDAAERDAQHHKSLVENLAKRDLFRAFVRDSRDRLTQARAGDDQALVRRAVHTVKGNASAFGLLGVAAIAHEIEHRALGCDIPTHELVTLQQSLDDYLVENHSVLGIDIDDRAEAGVTLSSDQLQQLAELSVGAPQPLRTFVQSLRKKSAVALLARNLGALERLAREQDKEVTIHLEGAHTLIDVEHQPLFAVVGHLLRNALDHGIERKGTLDISVSERDSQLSIGVRDDGRGIDAELLAAKAVSLGLISAETASNLSYAERLGLVFKDSLSTAAETTLSSGRGVGMGAVLAAAKVHGGTVVIDSSPGRGTCCTLQVPLRSY